MPTQPNLIRTGIPHVSKAVYPSGYTKYLLQYSRAGFSRKVSHAGDFIKASVRVTRKRN